MNIKSVHNTTIRNYTIPKKCDSKYLYSFYHFIIRHLGQSAKRDFGLYVLNSSSCCFKIIIISAVIWMTSTHHSLKQLIAGLVLKMLALIFQNPKTKTVDVLRIRMTSK